MRVDEFVIEARLADARLADYGDHLPQASTGALQRAVQRVHFALAADETSKAGDGGSLQARAHGGRAGQLEDFDWLCQPLHRDRAERANLH